MVLTIFPPMAAPSPGSPASPTTVLLCDLDGCLVDTLALITASFQHATRAVLGRACSPADVRGWVGEPLKATFARLAPGDAALAARCIDVYREHNLAHHDALIRRMRGSRARACGWPS